MEDQPGGLCLHCSSAEPPEHGHLPDQLHTLSLKWGNHQPPLCWWHQAVHQVWPNTSNDIRMSVGGAKCGWMVTMRGRTVRTQGVNLPTRWEPGGGYEEVGHSKIPPVRKARPKETTEAWSHHTPPDMINWLPEAGRGGKSGQIINLKDQNLMGKLWISEVSKIEHSIVYINKLHFCGEWWRRNVQLNCGRHIFIKAQ